MKGYILPGVLGLLLGLILRWTRLCRPAALRAALALRRSHALRSLLYFLGAGMALTALLCYLAVIDVDDIVVLPLSAGALIGGAVFGAAITLAGYTPLTAFAGLGGGRPLEALCTLAGCLAGTLLLPLLDMPLSALRTLPPYSATTLFAVTLDKPYLLGGGFLAQGCAGFLLMAIAACIPSNRQPAEAAEAPAPVDESSPDAPASDAAASDEAPADPPLLPEPLPMPLLPAPADAQDEPAAPESAQEETFIALLPGEEPLVVDTALDDDAEGPETPDASDPDDDPPPETPPGKP